MPAITRETDKCTGHDLCPPRPPQKPILNHTVYANGLLIVPKGQIYVKHGCPKHSPPHPGVLAQGSPTTYVEGMRVGRVGDLIECAGPCFVDIGSPNVFAN